MYFEMETLDQGEIEASTRVEEAGHHSAQVRSNSLGVEQVPVGVLVTQYRAQGHAFAIVAPHWSVLRASWNESVQEFQYNIVAQLHLLGLTFSLHTLPSGFTREQSVARAFKACAQSAYSIV